MKKFAYIVIAFVLGVFTSCTDKDDVEIIKHQSLTLNINTQGIYDDFNIKNAVLENYLRDESQCIGVFTWFYDSKGNLVTKGETYLKNFNPATQIFDKLAEDDYTVVIIETLVNPDDKYQSEVWSFDDSDKLSTLKITQRRGEPDTNGYRWTIPAYGGNAIGLYTGKISVKSSSAIEIRPKPIGSLIRFNPYNFENSNFVQVGYTTHDILDYYSPDPSLTRENRYKKNLTQSGKTNVRINFKADADPSGFWETYILEPEIDWQPITQTLDQYNQSNVSTWGALHANLEDGKTYYIGFYYLWNDGGVPYASWGFFENETDILEWKLQQDDVVSRHDGGSLFTEPYTTWNVGTVSAVKSYMNGYTLYQDIKFDSNFDLYSMIFFDETNYNTQYMYFFTSSTRGLTDAIVYLREENFSLEKVREEIVKQGYTYVDLDNNSYYYKNTSKGTGVSVNASYGPVIVDYYSLDAYQAAPMHKLPAIQPYKNQHKENKIQRNNEFKTSLSPAVFSIKTNNGISYMKKMSFSKIHK